MIEGEELPRRSSACEGGPNVTVWTAASDALGGTSSSWLAHTLYGLRPHFSFSLLVQPIRP